MPFAVITPQANAGSPKLYAIEIDGDIHWTADRRRVEAWPEAKADAVAADINRFAATEDQIIAHVVGFAPAEQAAS